MKKIILTIFLLSSLTHSETYDDRFLIYVNNNYLNFKIEKNQKQTNNFSLNQFLENYNIKKIEKWLPHAKKSDRDEDIFLNRFYVIKFGGEFDFLESAVKNIIELDIIDRAELMGIMKAEYQPNDPYYGTQWFLPNIRADLAFDLWDISSGELPGYSEENPIVVGVVDVGLDWDHPDLVNNLWQNLGEDLDGDGVVIEYNGSSWNFDSGDINGIDDDGDGYVDNFIGWDIANNDNNPNPPSGNFDHGTMVSGCVSASTDNGLGIASVGWGVKIMGINSSTEALVVTNASDGFLAAAQMGADIINLSLGSVGPCNSWQNLVNVAYNTYGCIIVASSGNGGNNGWTNFDLHSPSSCANVISVTATDPVDQFDCWATAGTTVDLSAPGWQIRTTAVGGGYTYTQGTSFSAPIVSGAAALLKSRYPNAANSFIEDLIINNTDPISAMNGSCQGTSLVGMLGSGRLNVYSSILAGDSLQGSGLFLEGISYLNDTDGDGIFNPGEQIKMKLVLGNQYGFLDAENVIATISTSDDRIAFLDNTISFPNPIVAGGSAFTLIDHFLVYAFDDAILGDIPCIVSIQSGLEVPYQITELELNISLSLNQKGFPVGEMNIESSPIIYNIDGNGAKEIVFGDEDGNLNVYSSAGYSQFGFPFESGDKIRSSPAIADIDLDGNIDLVFGSYDGNLYVSSPFGFSLLEYSQPGDIVGAPALVDLDLDGEKEIIFTTQYGNSGSLYAIRHDGTDVEGFPLDISEKMIAGPAVGDLEGDGSPDIVIVTWSDNLYVVDNIGNIKEGFPIVSTERFSISPILVDLDFDGDLEIITGNDNGLLQILEHSGEEVTSYDVGDDIRGGLSISDLDNNGSLEVLFTGYDDLLHVWSPDNQTELNGWPIDLNTNSISEPLTADLDNDGDLEVIAANKNGMFFIFHHDGVNFNGFPTNLNSYIESSPVIADLDEDGDFEIAVGTSSGLHVLDIKSPKGDIPSWKLHRGNYERSGSLGFTLVKVNEEFSKVPENFYVSNSFPNPFNPSTKFEVSIIEKNTLAVDVYNAVGRKVNSLMNKVSNPGRYIIEWNGKGIGGNVMPSGLYFIKVKSGNNFEIKKVLLIK